MLTHRARRENLPVLTHRARQEIRLAPNTLPLRRCRVVVRRTIAVRVLADDHGERVLFAHDVEPLSDDLAA